MVVWLYAQYNDVTAPHIRTRSDGIVVTFAQTQHKN